MKQSPLDTAEARGVRAAAVLHAHADQVAGDTGPEFIRQSFENFSARVRRCLKEGLRVFGNDPAGRKELTFRRYSWEIWLFGQLGACVASIDKGQSFNPTAALAAIAWLEGDISGFEETLRTTKAD